MAFITPSVISAEQLVRDGNFPDCGAVVVFEGRVRNEHEGRRVKGIFYEAYPPMAEKVMEGLCQEIQRQWPTCQVRALHRIGTLTVGEVAVAVVVWAPHRKEAFAACERLIDRIKREVPIWKQEIYGDGTKKWLEGC